MDMDEMFTTKIRSLAKRVTETVEMVSQKGGVIDAEMLKVIARDLQELKDYGSSIQQVSPARYGISNHELLDFTREFARAACIVTGVSMPGDGVETFQKLSDNARFAEFMMMVSAVSMMIGMGLVDEMVFGPTEKKKGDDNE